MSYPVFAVVGHPNKGKSSIVANLTRQDAVKISSVSGTTTQSQHFEMVVADQVLYALVDTPGFQRPRQVLSWLEKQCESADQRAGAVQRFLDEFAEGDRFVDETELLTPIMDNAGILYVVDGSVPYSPEYEAEMSILQWTGRPRMALVNPIGGEQYLEQWQQALGQYFSVVRVFNPMSAGRDKQRAVLSAFAEIYEPWRASIETAVDYLDRHLTRLHDSAAQLSAHKLVAMLSYEASVNVPTEFVESSLKKAVRVKYQEGIRQIESDMRREMQELMAHYDFELSDETHSLEFPDVFDTESWSLFGLSKKRLLATSASAGAAAGVVVDIGVGGASLMAGALAGGALTSAASMMAIMNPEKLKIKGVPLAGKTITVGPVKDLNFAFVLLGRTLGFLMLMRSLTHADRSSRQLPSIDLNSHIKALSKSEQVKLTRILTKAHKGLSETEAQQLCDWLLLFSE